MKIPTTFNLGSRKWTVRRGRKLKEYGRTYGNQCRIELSRINRTPEEELHTFCHELIHAFESTLGWELKEAKVDALANCLAQFLTTAE